MVFPRFIFLCPAFLFYFFFHAIFPHSFKVVDDAKYRHEPAWLPAGISCRIFPFGCPFFVASFVLPSQDSLDGELEVSLITVKARIRWRWLAHYVFGYVARQVLNVPSL